MKTTESDCGCVGGCCSSSTESASTSSPLVIWKSSRRTFLGTTGKLTFGAILAHSMASMVDAAATWGNYIAVPGSVSYRLCCLTGAAASNPIPGYNANLTFPDIAADFNGDLTPPNPWSYVSNTINLAPLNAAINAACNQAGPFTPSASATVGSNPCELSAPDMSIAGSKAVQAATVSGKLKVKKPNPNPPGSDIEAEVDITGSISGTITCVGDGSATFGGAATVAYACGMQKSGDAPPPSCTAGGTVQRRFKYKLVLTGTLNYTLDNQARTASISVEQFTPPTEPVDIYVFRTENCP